MPDMDRKQLYLKRLEEIEFWKNQEKEHTLVIRVLVPHLEPAYVLQLEEWEKVFEQTKKAAVQWKEWANTSKSYLDQTFEEQVNALTSASQIQSEEFIKQLKQIQLSSKSIQAHAQISEIVDHINRESQYFINRLESLSK
jgi:Fe-Mn family superoxide dismutase